MSFARAPVAPTKEPLGSVELRRSSCYRWPKEEGGNQGRRDRVSSWNCRFCGLCRFGVLLSPPISFGTNIGITVDQDPQTSAASI